MAAGRGLSSWVAALVNLESKGLFRARVGFLKRMRRRPRDRWHTFFMEGACFVLYQTGDFVEDLIAICFPFTLC